MAAECSEKTAVGSYQNNHYALPMWHKHAGSMINILQMWVLLCKYAECSEYESVWRSTNLYIGTSVISYMYIVTLQNEVQIYAMAWDHIGWDQTLLLLHKKSSTFWKSILVFFSFKYLHGDELFHVHKGSWCWPTASFSVSGCLYDFKCDVVASDCCGSSEEGSVN